MERPKKTLQLAAENRAAELPDFDALDGRRQIAEACIAYVQTRVVTVDEKVLERGRIITSDRRDEVGSAYRLLRTQVLQRVVAKHWQTLAVVSPAAGEGKTVTAINLAIAIASTRSHTALLVDLDWRQPSVHTYFGLEPERDIHDYLRGGPVLADVLVNPGIPRFCFLPCGKAVPEASDLLSSLGGFVAELKSRYANRIVLFDLPPLLPTDDALSFLPHVDGAVLVVEEQRTSRDDVARSIELIGAERLLGTVVNKSTHKTPRY
jgi:Mrp family chromosome partitioning ATPase